MSEAVTVKMCRIPGVLKPDQMFFRPALIYQQMLEEHVADAGLEFSLDVSTGQNFARFISDVKVEADSDRHKEILRAQLRLVDESQGRGDSKAVRKHLLAAASWGDSAKTALLLRTCWVTPTLANQVLVEASQAGSPDVIRHEEVAAMLIPRMSKIALGFKTKSTGFTAFEILRRAELAGMARRLEALVPP